MRSGKVGITYLAAGLILWSMSCSSERGNMQATQPKASPASNGQACDRDGDCRSGFCDHRTCAQIGAKENYGRQCMAWPLGGNPPVYDGIIRAADGSLMITGPKAGRHPEYSCEGYPCLQERCRSCESDADCEHWRSGPTCMAVEGFPGKQCRSLADAGTVDASPVPAPSTVPSAP